MASKREEGDGPLKDEANDSQKKEVRVWMDGWYFLQEIYLIINTNHISFVLIQYIKCMLNLVILTDHVSYSVGFALTV